MSECNSRQGDAQRLQERIGSARYAIARKELALVAIRLNECVQRVAILKHVNSTAAAAPLTVFTVANVTEPCSSDSVHGSRTTTAPRDLAFY